MLKQYINSIRKNEDGFLFSGDGCGDFEETEYHAENRIVKDYIEYCEKQIEVAKEYLERK